MAIWMDMTNSLQTWKGGVCLLYTSNPKQADIQFFEREIEDRADYTLITEQMEKPRLNALIRLCDVFISLHRSLSLIHI